MEIILYCDGGSLGNPGKGYGSWQAEVRKLQAIQSGKRIQFGDHLTNNQAEYLALLCGLKNIGHSLDQGHFRQSGVPIAKECHLRIFSDSRLMVMQIRGRWKCKLLHLRELRDEVKSLLARFDRWDASWVPRKEMVKRFGH